MLNVGRPSNVKMVQI